MPPPCRRCSERRRTIARGYFTLPDPAVPAIRPFRFGAAYGAAIGAAYVIGALGGRHGIEPRLGAALALYAVGAVVAGVASALFLPWWVGDRPWSARFAAAVAVLSALTVGLGAFALFVAVAILQSSRWGAPFSMEWIGSMIVNSGASLVYTITLGLPMLIPLGMPVMFLGAWHLAHARRLSPPVPPVRPRSFPEAEGTQP